MRFNRIAVAALAVSAVALGVAQADASSPHLANLVGQGPVSFTPNVSAGTTVGQSTCNTTFFGSASPCQSEVYDTAYVNGDVVVVGAFTQACQPGTLAQGLCKPGTQVTRNDIFAYTAGTGLIDPNFVPVLDKGPVWSVIPGPAGSDEVFIGGAFAHVNGAAHKGIVVLHVNPGVTTGASADGAVVTSFKANVANLVHSLALSPDGRAVYAGGQFATANGVAETGLVRFNASTGAVDPSFHITLGDPITNDPLKVEAMDLTADGSLLAVSGTALQANGQSRPRLAIISTGITLGGTAQLTDFTAPILANNCSAEHDYVRALSFAPDGSYLVVANTGFLNDGSMPFSVCDAVARFNVGAAATTTTGTPVSVAPQWINYAGGDSFYSVTVAGGVTYVGGHNRWVNNYCGQDSLCGANALAQGGLSALDSNTGVGLAWWHPMTLRGAGTMYLNTFQANTYDKTHNGLVLGTDVDVVGGQFHSENALLPVASATTKTPFGTIPSGMFHTEGGTNTGTAMCLDDPSDSSAAGTAVAISTCLNVAEQNWSVPAAGATGQLQINGLCLDTASGLTDGGTGVVLAACSPTTATQQWTQGSGNTLINQGATTAQGSSMCLDDPGSSTTSGTALDIATCSGGTNQAWPLPAAPGPAAGAPSGPFFPQVLQSDGQQPCMDDNNNVLTAGNKVQMWTCRGDAQQNWVIEPGGTIQLGASTCLDTANGATSNSANVVVSPCSGSTSQTWTRGANNSLIQQASGRCLDDPGSNAANGTQLIIFTCNAGRNQNWRIAGW